VGGGVVGRCGGGGGGGGGGGERGVRGEGGYERRAGEADERQSSWGPLVPPNSLPGALDPPLDPAAAPPPPPPPRPFTILTSSTPLPSTTLLLNSSPTHSPPAGSFHLSRGTHYNSSTIPAPPPRPPPPFPSSFTLLSKAKEDDAY